jgi:hypothetical protein
VRKKYYGEEHARDLKSELKGATLLSNSSFRQREKWGYSINLTIAREILEWVKSTSIRYAGISVYGNKKPPLLASDLKSLSAPFRELCIRLLSHIPANQNAQLIFDQRLGAQEEISIAVHNYIAGIREGQRRITPNPAIGVSNVWPGLQLADIVAHILGKYAIGDKKFDTWYNGIKSLQIEGTDHHGKPIFGFVRLQWEDGDHYSVRRNRAKK